MKSYVIGWVVIIALSGMAAGVIVTEAAIVNDWQWSTFGKYTTVEKVLENSYRYKIEYLERNIGAFGRDKVVTYYTNDLKLRINNQVAPRELEVVAEDVAYASVFNRKTIRIESGTSMFSAPVLFFNTDEQQYFVRVTRTRDRSVIVDTITDTAGVVNLLIDPSYLTR